MSIDWYVELEKDVDGSRGCPTLFFPRAKNRFCAGTKGKKKSCHYF
jgi:hypothetical protein